MPITLKGTPVRTHVSTSTTTWQISLPTGLAAGDVVEIVVAGGSNLDFAALPPGAHPTTLLASYDDNNDGTWDADGDPTARIFLYTVPANPPATITVTTTVAVAGNAYATAYSGVDATDGSAGYVVVNHLSGSGTTVTSPSLTTAVDGCYITRGMMITRTGAASGPAGAAAFIGNVAAQSPTSGVAAMGVKSPAGATGTAEFTYADTANWGTTWTHALKPSGATPPAVTSGWQLGSIAM